MMVGPYNLIDNLRKSHCVFFYEETGALHSRSLVESVYASTLHDVAPNEARPYYIYCKPPDMKYHVPHAVTFILPNYFKEWFSKDLNRIGAKREYLIPIRGSPHLLNSSAKIHSKNETVKIMNCIKPSYDGVFGDVEEQQLINALVFHHNVGMDHTILFDSGGYSPQQYRLFNELKDAGVSIEVFAWNFRENGGMEHQQNLVYEVCYQEALLKGFTHVVSVSYTNLYDLILYRSTYNPSLPNQQTDVDEIIVPMPLNSSWSVGRSFQGRTLKDVVEQLEMVQ
jgi:hypothetical protein